MQFPTAIVVLGPVNGGFIADVSVFPGGSLDSVFATLILVGALSGQTSPPQHSPSETGESIRIWVSDKQSGTVQGSFSSADLMKEINAMCIGVVLTDNHDKADFRLEAGRAWCCTSKGQSRGYKFALFNKDGDATFSTQTHDLRTLLKICAMRSVWGNQNRATTALSTSLKSQD